MAVDYAEESKWYKHGIIENPLESDKKYDAIIVAVGHKVFKEYVKSDYGQLSNDIQIVIDVKNIVNDATWRL